MDKKQIWFVTGSQHLYGEGIFEKVNAHSKEIAGYFDDRMPCRVVFKPVVTTSDEIAAICKQASFADECIGVIAWMHTFSPSKMWISGLQVLGKPLLHLHTQYNRDIPFDSIDMDFMNLNQSAHGDREFGYLCTRMNRTRKVVVGFWKDEGVIFKIQIWVRAATGYDEGKNLKIARFGDNMRDVAVTEGNKVSAQITFGWSVSGFGLGDLSDYIERVTEEEIEFLMQIYAKEYGFLQEDAEAIRVQARYEAGIKRFLDDGKFGAFTTTFENLQGLKQLPGLAVQRLMQQGYGFGAEGDWKTAGLVRMMKNMALGLSGGTSFMEDYTYHFEPGNEMVLGAHMLEVCPSIAADKPKIKVHSLGIGGKEPPARLVFEGKEGRAVLVSLIELQNRYRLILNEAEIVRPNIAMPKLPVARVLLKPEPSLAVSAQSWILAGGAHHTCLSTALSLEHLEDFADMVQVELVVINKDTKMSQIKNQLALGDVIWR